MSAPVWRGAAALYRLWLLRGWCPCCGARATNAAPLPLAAVPRLRCLSGACLLALRWRATLPSAAIRRRALRCCYARLAGGENAATSAGILLSLPTVAADKAGLHGDISLLYNFAAHATTPAAMTPVLLPASFCL